MTSKRELEESIDELRRSYGKLHSEVWDVLDLRSSLKELDGVKYVLKYLIEENKTFKTDLIKNYINAQRQRKNYMAEHKQDSGDKILDDPYYAKLTGRIITIGEIYEFLYNKPISDGIVDQYVDASNED